MNMKGYTTVHGCIFSPLHEKVGIKMSKCGYFGVDFLDFFQGERAGFPTLILANFFLFLDQYFP